MIKDKLQNAENYYGISARLKAGFEWLKNNDMVNMPDGRYYIDKENIYANVQSYDTKDDAPFESHRKYIDIQYMIKGDEKCGITNYKNCKTTEAYDSEKDIEFLSCTNGAEYLRLEEGEFLVFLPQDAHQPALDNGEKKFVKKVIVKVAV